jgi:hypothetical protein
MKKPVCYNKKTLEILDMDNKVVATCTTLKNAITLTKRLNSGAQFNDFQDIRVPKFLNSPAWLDESWGNDVTAHVRLDEYNEINFELWIWVHPENKEERESPEYTRFVVSVYEHDTGNELESIEAETESECMKAIEEMRRPLDILKENHANA